MSHSRSSNYDSLGAVPDAERLEHGGHMDLYRALGKAEFISDLLVRLASAQGREHLALPWTQAAASAMLVLRLAVTFRWLRARVEGHRRDIDATAEDEVECAPQDRGTARFGDIAAGSMIERLANVADVLGRRDNNQGHLRLERPHGADALEARTARHARIHQDKVVASPVAALINQLVEGSHLTKSHLLLERLQQEPQSGTEQLVVITDQYFHRRTLDLERRCQFDPMIEPAIRRPTEGKIAQGIYDISIMQKG